MNKFSARSITPYESSYNTESEKEFLSILDRNHSTTRVHKRVISNDSQNYKIESPHTIRNFCGNCIRLERHIHDLKRKQQKYKEGQEIREKHLRQLDSLLQIKDKRLKEEENNLKIEKNQIGRETEDLKKIIKDCQNEKFQLEKENKALAKENSNIVVNLKKAEMKYTEIQKHIKKYEDEKQNIEENIRSQIFKSFESRESSLKKKESEISLAYQKLNYENQLIEEKNMKLAYYEENLLIQEQSIKLKYEELSNFSAELERSEAKLLQDQESLKIESENQLSFIKNKEAQLSASEKALKSKFSMLDAELASIESLKVKLHEQQLILNEEINNYRKLQMDMIEDQSIPDFDKEQSLVFEEKEKYIEEMIERLNEEEKQFAERWAGLKKIEENLKSEVDYFKSKCEELEQKSIRRDESFSIEFQEKLVSLSNKEEELLILENNLKKERQEIDSTAELIKTLNNDLLYQKIKQDEENEKINREKERLLELLRSQEEKAKILAEKEQDLLNFRDFLQEREKGLVSHDNSEDYYRENKRSILTAPCSIPQSPKE